MGKPRALRVALVAAALLLFAAATLVASTSSEPEHSAAGTASGPDTTVLDPPSPTTAPPIPAPPHEPVPAAAPTHFQIAGPAFTIDADVCQMPNIRPLDPPGDQYHTVCWVYEGFGVAPGSDAGGTSYILGHAWAEAPLVLNPLSETAMAQAVTVSPQPLDGVDVQPIDVLNGYLLSLQLPGGTLTYTVTRAYAVPKMQAANVASLMDESTPNRIVLITCGVHDGRDYDVNVIVEAYLTVSVSSTPT